MHEAIATHLEARLAYRPEKKAISRFGDELLAFGIKNALACAFPAFIFLSLALTKILPVPFLPRYDLLLLLCLGMQMFMVWAGIETKDEVKVICLFHVLGLVMEIHKVRHGAWSYPDFGYTKLFGVPLYSGFMYASVASFLTQSWRYFGTRLHRWPPRMLTALLGLGIYVNFFTNEYVPDVRRFLILALFIIFLNTSVSFGTNGRRRRMSVILAFLLIGLFIWLAENIGTLLGAWQYQYQAAGWKLVHPGTISSWFLLVIVSFILVAELKLVKERAGALED